MEYRTKNDDAWEQIFSKYNILNHINSEGTFEIQSKQINEFRQSRLMAKFDHTVNLPKIFKDNNLSILPVSRSSYLIGRFKTHEQISYSTAEPQKVEALDLESISHTNLYSESSSLLYAFNSGMIDHLIGEEVSFTLNGRMSSDKFRFEIQNSTTKSSYPINVENAQIEIDAGFESDNYLILIEAKNTKVDDFLIRQIYYPYRLWSNKVNKDIVNVFMTYSNDVFSFFVYEFESYNEYNSLNLLEQKSYLIAPEEINLDDVIEVFKNITVIDEPKNAPFPQADIFERIIDLLGLLYDRTLSTDEITLNYEFTSRQAYYYTAAGIYLGLIGKTKNSNNEDIIYYLTDLGKSIMEEDYQKKYLSIIQLILRHNVFYEVFQLLVDSGEIPDNEDIINIMLNQNLNYGRNTINRRSQTIRRWINWIIKLTNAE